MSAATSPARTALRFDVLAERGLVWHGSVRVPLNDLDKNLSEDVYDAFLKRRSKIYVYPIPCYVLPSIIVATLLVNTFGRCLDKNRVPKVLFYTGIDGRDLYRDIGIGVQRECLSETFGFTRLNADGLPIESVKLTSQLPLVVTGHCVLPKDQGYRPDVVVIDGNEFEADKLASLIGSAAARWPAALFYVVLSNPINPVIGTSSKLHWALLDLLHYSGPVGAVPKDEEFANVTTQLRQFRDGVTYRAEVLGKTPSPAWAEVQESLTLAKKHVRTLRSARHFVAAARWLTDLAVLPSEYEAYRMPNMLSFAERVHVIRDEARHEGRTAQLIAGGCGALGDVCEELERENRKRDALLEAVLEACYAGKSATILVQRPGMRAVLAQAAQVFPECVEMLDQQRLKYVSVSNISTAQMSDTVIVPAVLSMHDMWALRTTIASNMLFIAYHNELALQTWCLKEIGLLDARSSISGLEAVDAVPSMDGAPTDDTLAIELNDLFQDEPSLSVAAGSGVAISGPRREVWFEDGTCNTIPDAAKVHVLVDTDEPLQSKPARAIEPGDWLVVVNGDAQQGLFEALREHVDAKTSLSQAIEVVKAFQRALKASFEAERITVEQLHRKLVALGSDIQSPLSVTQWLDGTLFGPRDAKDIARLGKALAVSLFEDRYQEFYRSMQRVRVAHRELGRVLVRVITNAYRETDSKSVRITVDGESVVLYDVLQAVTLKRVREIREMR